jgi:ferredoxin
MTEPTAVLSRAGLDELIGTLISEGYRVVGPTVRDDAIVLAELTSGAELPAGWGVETAPGRYRLRRRTDEAVFAHSAGPQSWKQFLHPSRQKLWSTDGAGFSAPIEEDHPPYAFIGVRGCDLAAVATLGTVLGRGAHPDASFGRRRAGLFVVAAGCTEPGGVCFCASMGTGPAPGPGYDLALTEQIDEDGHRFIIEVGTAAGQRIMSLVNHRTATAEQVAAAHAAVEDAATHMGREMPSLDIRELLWQSRESPSWSDVAERCLTCGNCTMVCPTCFCTSTEDTSDLSGEHAERWQHWASCFELDFSYLHGGSVRSSGESRYRQWITHKLSTWHDQFGGSGCVGCGRCIAWCPVGIDITEEVATLARLREEQTSEEDHDDGHC